jgi:hypothetical protein
MSCQPVADAAIVVLLFALPVLVVDIAAGRSYRRPAGGPTPLAGEDARGRATDAGAGRNICSQRSFIVHTGKRTGKDLQIIGGRGGGTQSSA